VYDVSNACLGILNGMVQVANMIELGQIRAGLVVGTEGSRQLVETTIETLNRDATLTREQIKLSVASLTIGSASAAVLLCDRELSRSGNRLTCAAARANTTFHRLCRSGADESVADGMRPLMRTDSERLMREGIATGAETFTAFLAESGWTVEQIHKSFCHQVGLTHRRVMLEALGIDPAIDYTTVETLGNTGSAALPVTLALGMQDGHLERGDHVALLGIGSGIHSLMLALQWQECLVLGHPVRPARRPVTVTG
jgi:3-oxoacyl-[acyl-carrier-protein] synthase-3